MNEVQPVEWERKRQGRAASFHAGGELLRFAALCAMAWFAVDPIAAEVAAQAPDESAPQAQAIPDFVFARMAENPLTSVTRVPVLNSAQFGLPPRDRAAYGLVLAPIIPKVFDGGWSIITRVTIPAVVTVPFASDAVPPSTGRTMGFGDIGFEALGHKMIRGKKRQFYDVGLGPFVGFPSASDDFLGTGRWRLGPEIALGITARQWVAVLIGGNEWSVGNKSDRVDVNQLSMAFLLFYNLPKLFYLVYEPLITANWKSQPGDRWTLPVGLGFGRHFRLPKRPRLGMTSRVSGFYNAVRPDNGASWQLVATLVFFNPNRAVFDF